MTRKVLYLILASDDDDDDDVGGHAAAAESKAKAKWMGGDGGEGIEVCPCVRPTGLRVLLQTPPPRRLSEKLITNRCRCFAFGARL